MDDDENLDPVLLLQKLYPGFSEISEKHLMQMKSQDAVRPFTLSKGEEKECRGDNGHDSLYLLSGAVRYHTADHDDQLIDSDHTELKPLHIRDGEILVLKAEQDSLLCLADSDEVDYMISWASLVDTNYDSRSDISWRLAAMNNPSIFMQLPFEYVEAALKRITEVDVSAGDIIIRQGDAADSFYIIEQGRAEVLQQGIFDDAETKVAELDIGDHFGEEALIHGGARNATIRMLEDGHLLVLDKMDFENLIHSELVKMINPEDAHEMVEDGDAVFLDVRYEEEFYDLHLKDAILIPLSELRKRFDELDGHVKYITCCDSSRRSSVAAMLLNKQGIDAAYLKGGIRSWPYELVDEMAVLE